MRQSSGSVPVAVRCSRILVHMWRSRSSSTRTRCGSPGARRPEEAADQEHHLAVGVVVRCRRGAVRRTGATTPTSAALCRGAAGVPPVRRSAGAGRRSPRRPRRRAARPPPRRAGRRWARRCSVRVVPLEDVVRGTVDEDEFDAGCVQCVGDRLVLGRGLGDRCDHRQRGPLGGSRRSRSRRPGPPPGACSCAVGSAAAPCPRTSSRYTTFGCFTPQTACHGQRGGGRVVADGEDLQGLAHRAVDVLDDAEDALQGVGPVGQRRSSPATARAALRRCLRARLCAWSFAFSCVRRS